jgi:hypothetical protein
MTIMLSWKDRSKSAPLNQLSEFGHMSAMPAPASTTTGNASVKREHVEANLVYSDADAVALAAPALDVRSALKL